jgi:CYTH domain-containing protein
MTREIERKFLVNGTAWKTGAVAERIEQGYLSTDERRTVRVRTEGDRAVLTIKGKARGITRSEFEYRIPLADARALLRLCDLPLIEKTRHTLLVGCHIWHVDEFHGDNAGLVIAEIELKRPDEHFHRPAWLGHEVSGDERYFNVNLSRHPFTSWMTSASQRATTSRPGPVTNRRSAHPHSLSCH